MNAPPYHLRANKSVDRFLFVEAIRRVTELANLSKYTYYGLGGPYLEDFRVMYEMSQSLRMVSIEQDEQVFRRQCFHLPTKNLSLFLGDLFQFIDAYDAHGEKSLFWLDFTDLRYSNIEYFEQLLTKVSNGSILKISLRARAMDYNNDEKWGTYCERFHKLLPGPTITRPVQNKVFARMILGMLRVAAQRTLPSSLHSTFQPISCFRYSDSTPILTLTGVVCSRECVSSLKSSLIDWEFANLDWGDPMSIDMPALSSKERLHLQRHLPLGFSAGEELRDALGYAINPDESRGHCQLNQYASFHRYYPHFIRATP